MIQNIIFITLIIIVFFFVSNEEKLNNIISKKNIKFLLILLIIYFVYQNYNIILLIIAILIFIFLNIENNKYLNFNKLESFKIKALEYYKEWNIKEKFSNKLLYEVKPYIHENKNKSNKENITNNTNNINNTNKKKTIEPFKEEVTKLKDLYENIKNEIKKLS